MHLSTIFQLGWSNEASTLEIPRPRPQISRVFEVEASLFFRFRGFSRPRLAEKFEDFLRVYLEKPSKIKARLRSWMLRIFEDSSKNLEKMNYFVHKIALKTEIFRGSSKNRPFYTSEVFSRVALKKSLSCMGYCNSGYRNSKISTQI